MLNGNVLIELASTSIFPGKFLLLKAASKFKKKGVPSAQNEDFQKIDGIHGILFILEKYGCIPLKGKTPKKKGNSSFAIKTA